MTHAEWRVEPVGPLAWQVVRYTATARIAAQVLGTGPYQGQAITWQALTSDPQLVAYSIAQAQAKADQLNAYRNSR